MTPDEYLKYNAAKKSFIDERLAIILTENEGMDEQEAMKIAIDCWNKLSWRTMKND